MALKPIEIVINAKDNASKVFDGLNAKLKAVAAAVAAYIGINAFANVVKGAADFEEAMDRVQAATNASGEELAQLKAAAEAAGATTKFTAIEAASALENLAKAGLTGKEAIAALPAVMNLAQAGGGNLADTTERLTGVVMGMGLAFTESGRVADVLAMGANASRSSITGLAEAMSYAAPVAKTVGLSLESTTAIIGQFANAGIDASRAGTALNSILSQFSDPASKFKQELAGLGITTTNFDEALKQLAATGPRGAAAVRSVGLEAGPALQAALNLGIPALEDLRKKLQESAGSAEATAEVMGDNLNGALKGLSSAWDAVKNTLGEPVLPALKSGVEQLSGALQAAVADGTIAKFGTALATAFQSAVTWVKEFLAAFDFDQVSIDMQAFATRAGEVFDQIGQYATNAGNIVKLAYGVMSAGTNAVLTAIYGIGSGFSAVAEQVMLGVAKIRDGLATVTFGDLSKSFSAAADDARNMAQFFGEAAQAMRDKATESMIAVADSANLARDGFSGLAGGADKTKVSADAAAASLKAAAQETKRQADEASKALAAMAAQEAQWLQNALAMDKVGQSAGAMGEAVKTGAAQGTKSATEMAKALETAYAALGIVSTEKLKNIADAAKTAFETIKDSGTASADDIGKAFASAAEKAIAANNGLAPAWVKAEAAARGYKIEVDEAGKATLKLVSAQDSAAQAFAKAGEAIKAKTAAMKAESDLVVSGLELRKSELDASIKIAEANGDEAKAIKLKIEQKRIEIQIIQETVKAQIAEAQASADMARAKMSELQATGSLTVEKKAELQAQIKGAEASINQAKARGQSVRTIEEEIKALQASSSGYDKNASFINQTTAALEKMNAAREKEIAAQEKKIQLDEREQELYRKKWQMDKEGYSVDADGKRIEQVNETQQSIYNKGKDAGLTAKQAQELADRFAPRGKDQFFRNNEFWQEVNRLKQLNDLAEEELKNKPAAPAPSPAPAAPAPSPAPIRPPAPAPAPRQPQQPSGDGGSTSITGPSAPGAVGGLGNTYISNITLPGVGRISPRFADGDSQAQVEGFLRALAAGKGVAQ